MVTPTVPSYRSDSPAPTGGGREATARSCSLQFWKAFSRSNEEECREALRLLEEVFGDEYVLSEGDMSSPESLGKFVKVELPVASPRSAQEAWKSNKHTRLVRVDPNTHCLAYDGNAKDHEGSPYFVVCGMLGAGDVSPAGCTVGTHTQRNRPRFELSGAAYVIRVRPSSMATKPKVLSGVFLLERDIPLVLIESGVITMLTELEALPRVWKYVLETYPGLTKMLDIDGPSEASVAESFRSASEHRSMGNSVVSQFEAAPQEPKSPPSVVEVDDDAESQVDNEPLDAAMMRAFGVHYDFTAGMPETFADRASRFDFDSAWRAARTEAGGAFTGSDSGDGWSTQTHPESRSTAIGRLEASLLRRITAQRKEWLDYIRAHDAQLNRAFQDIGRWALDGANKARGMAAVALSEAKAVGRELGALEERIQGLSTSQVRKELPPVQTFARPAAPAAWEHLSPSQRAELARLLVSELDQTTLLQGLASKLDVNKLSAASADQQEKLLAVDQQVKATIQRVGKVEQELHGEHGLVQEVVRKIEDLESRRNEAVVERAGYLFTGPPDVDAFIELAGQPTKMAIKCIDIIDLLTLAQDPYVTYEAAMQVHANAIKANYDSVLESRLKVSYEIPFPEIIVKCVENANTVARGGAKWGAMFATAEVFEDDFRDGAHRRVVKGVDNAYDLIQKAIDHDFPIGFAGSRTSDLRKVHAILTDQLRLAYRQTIEFLNCLLPFHKTLKGGSLTSEEAWDRVFVFVMEFLTSVQEKRVLSLDTSNEASLIWGALRATDHVEEFRRQKFVEHPKALSILALTSIEREGKTMALLETKIAKQIADVKTGDKFTKLDTRISALENKLKNLFTKNPDLK